MIPDPLSADNYVPQVVDTIHAQGSYVFLQLWALGRMARPGYGFKAEEGITYVAPSPVPLRHAPDVSPRELTKDGQSTAW